MFSEIQPNAHRSLAANKDGGEDQGGRSQLGRGAEAAESHLRRLAAADRKLGNHPAGKGLPGDLGSWGFGGAESAGFRWDFSIGILLSKIFFRIKKSKKTDKNGISKKRIKTGYHEMIADGIYIYIFGIMDRIVKGFQREPSIPQQLNTSAIRGFAKRWRLVWNGDNSYETSTTSVKRGQFLGNGDDFYMFCEFDDKFWNIALISWLDYTHTYIYRTNFICSLSMTTMPPSYRPIELRVEWLAGC